MQEAKELREATEQYHAQPLEDNLYEWHFTIRGAPDTDFADGVRRVFFGKFLTR